jgi:hypothetical protein
MPTVPQAFDDFMRGLELGECQDSCRFSCPSDLPPLGLD